MEGWVGHAAVRDLPLLWVWHRKSWGAGGADLGDFSSLPSTQFSKGLGHVNSAQEGAHSAGVQLLTHVWKRISSTVCIISCVFCAGNPFGSFQVKLYWYAVNLWQPFISSETFDANFKVENSHQVSVLGKYGKYGSKDCFLLQVIKENTELPTDCCDCDESLPHPTVQKNLFYSLFCAFLGNFPHLQTSFLMGLTAQLTTLQIFLKSGAEVDSSTISICLMEMGVKTLGTVLTEDLVDFQCSSHELSRFESIIIFIILNLNESEHVRRDSV